MIEVAIIVAALVVGAAVYFKRPSLKSIDAVILEARIAQQEASEELVREREAHARTLLRQEKANALKIDQLEAKDRFDDADVIAGVQCGIANERLRLVDLEEPDGNERS